MWGRAPCSSRQENVFMGDLYPSGSHCSCHCTQWEGVVSLMRENKYSSSQTNDISCQYVIKPSRVSLQFVSRLAWAAWQTATSHDLLQLCLIFVFQRWYVRSQYECKHVWVQAQLMKWAAERRSVCQLAPGWGSSPPQTSYLPRTLLKPASQMWCTGNPTSPWWSILTQSSPTFTSHRAVL